MKRLEIPDIFYSEQFWIILGLIIFFIIFVFIIMPDFMNIDEKMCEWCAKNC